MKNWLWGLLLLLLASWLQLGGFNSLLPFRMDFLLLVVVAFGVLNGPKQGLVFGLFAGALQAGLSGSLLFLLTKAVVGFLAGKLDRFLYRHQGLVVMTLVAVGTLLHETLLAIFLLPWFPVTHVGHFLGPLVLMNALVAPLLYFPARPLLRSP